MKRKPGSCSTSFLKVTDESGTPIANAKVVVGEGLIHTQSDQDGTVTFKGYPESVVTITAPLI